MTGERILIVDDEPGVRSALGAVLTDEGFRVSTADSGEAGLDCLDRSEFDAVMLDVWLPGIDGLETLKRLRERHPDVEVVMISGHGTIETAVRATRLGAFDFVEKPLSLEKTLVVVRNALRQRQLERVNVQLLEHLTRDTEIHGDSAAARKLRHDVEIASASTAPVWILGERGTGRENVVRRIHASGPAPEAPFVEIPCSALDPAAAESSLFGDGGRAGRFELALGGSMYLEEVDALSQELQGRLAAVLTRSARDSPRARILASTRPEAAELHPDLARFLDVIRIEVPSLRARREDVAPLAERFMRELSREYGRDPRKLAPDALGALRAHDWPGNVSELRNLVERLVLFAPGEVVGVADLPHPLGGEAQTVDDLYAEFPSLADGLAAFERYFLRRVIREHGTDRSAAARRLGISKKELEQRMENL